MSRKQIRDEHEHPDRWLVSYADFITLLFAFFVVMYAISSINEGKYRVLSDSLVHAFKEVPSTENLISLGEGQPGLLDGSGEPIGQAAPRRPKEATQQPVTERMKSIARDVKSAMASLERQGQVRVIQTPRGITVEISASTLFASGDATLQPQSAQALAAVAKVMAEIDNPIQVEGHTDNVPISVPSFPSNWELSSARAGSVVRLLVEQGVPPGRLVAIGYADNKPIDTNATAEGRSRNRRVNVMILNKVDGAQELAL